MSKGRRHHNVEVPEEQQHEPITMPENPVTGHPIGTDTEVVHPVGVLRDIAGRIAAEQPGVTVDEASFDAAEREVSAMTPEPQSAKVLERTRQHAAEAPVVKQMVEQQVAVSYEQRIFRCVYDDHALARKTEVGAKDPDVFCPVCGNRLVRER